MKAQYWFHMLKNQFAARKPRRVFAVTLMASLIGITTLANAQTQLVSINRNGATSGNRFSNSPVISADGRFVAFYSAANDLVSNDLNGNPDIFVRDLQNGTTTLVSINLTGTNSGNNECNSPSINADGWLVAFASSSSDLVSNDMNQSADIFVRDLQSGITTLVSVNRDGTNGGNLHSVNPKISADGRFVAFESQASDLASNDTNDGYDVFIRELQSGTTALVSINRDGTNSGNGASVSSLGLTISADGRFVAFESYADDLVSNDMNGQQDVFIRDLQTGTTSLVSVNRNATNSGNSYSFLPMLSANGRFLAFISPASDLVSNDANGGDDVFVRDLQAGTTILVSINRFGTNSGNSTSTSPVISADGRFVAFYSGASDLVSNDTNSWPDYFVRDLQNGTTTLVSVNFAGTQSGNNVSGSFFPAISADGRFVAFHSAASDLVSNDTNNQWDAFVRDLQSGATCLASINRDGTNGGNNSTYGTLEISADGKLVVFVSPASDLVSNDANGTLDIFAREMEFNQLPIITAGGPYIANEGSSVVVTASGSDPENGPLIYAWDLDNDGNFETPGQSATFSAANIDGLSSHTINVQVTDDVGLTATSQATVEVFNAAPTATFTCTPSTIIAGQSVTLAFTDPLDPSAADVGTGFQHFYDCTGNGTFEDSDPAAASHVHTYPASGSFTASGRIQDKDGGLTDYTAQVIVLTPQDAIRNLIAQVLALNKPQGNGLINGKLDVAIKRLDNNEIDKAIDKLQDFIKQVNVFMNNGTFTVAEGQPLVDAAETIIAALSNPAQATVAGLKKDASEGLAASTSGLPTEFQLAQNSPNPFNPTTTIQFSVPREGFVRLKVYNSFGAEVATLVDQQVAAGSYKITWNASHLASGIYMYRLEAEGFAQARRLLLMK